MPGGTGKGFFDRTWAQTFDETRDVASRSTPVNLPYGRHIMEVQGRGGRGDQDTVKTAYTVTQYFPARIYSQPSYQVTQPSYNVTTNYPARTFFAPSYVISTTYPTRQVTPQPAYSVTTAYPTRQVTPQPAYSVTTAYPTRQVTPQPGIFGHNFLSDLDK